MDRSSGHDSLGFAALIIGCLLVLAVEPFEWIDIRSSDGPWALLAGFVIAIAAGVALCTLVQRPSCRGRVIWPAISREHHPSELRRLLLSPNCRLRGFPDDPRS